MEARPIPKPYYSATRVENNPQPDKLVSREGDINRISEKVDLMKSQVGENKNTYFEDIKEKAEARRQKFYNQGLQ